MGMLRSSGQTGKLAPGQTGKLPGIVILNEVKI
jgi:hypothetical protein